MTPAPALAPQNLILAEATRLAFRANIPPGIPLERVMEPDYWAHLANKLGGGLHKVECLAQDGTWYAELMVRKVTKDSVHFWLLTKVDLNGQVAKPAAPVKDEYIVKFGGAHKWRVIRASDNEVMHHSEPTEADAKAWLDEFLKQPA